MFARSGQLAEEQTGPAVDVVFLDLTSHPGHAGAFAPPEHLDGRANRVGRFFDVVGVHEQGIPVSSRAAPVKRLKMSTPSSSSADRTNSLATRFMPSCSEETRQKSA